MKKLISLSIICTMCTLLTSSLNAQWTQSGSNTYLNNSGDKVGIGTITPTNKLDVQGTAPYIQVKSSAGVAGIIIDKSAQYYASYLKYRTGGIDKWLVGCKSFDNFYITNMVSGVPVPVIVINSTTNHVGIGGASASPANSLSVSGSANFSGNVGIGTSSPAYTLQIEGSSASSLYNCYSKVNYTGPTDVIAFFGNSHPSDGAGYGIEGYGGYIGVHGRVSDGAYGEGFAVIGSAVGTSGSQYGIYGEAAGGITNWGVYSAGATYSTGGYQSSDIKLKKDIKLIENALDKIKQLQPRTYNFKTDEYKYMGLPVEQQYGFIAQDIEKVFPEIVKNVQQPIDGDSKKNGVIQFKAINYTEIIPVLTEAMQEQQQQIEAKDVKIALLENRMKQFEQTLSQCCSNFSSANNKSTVNENDAAKLEQNQPNPFDKTSVINYRLKSNDSNAKIVIRDINGNLVKQVSLIQTGKGQVTINANELAQGTYTYTLEINNMSVDTKLMVVTK